MDKITRIKNALLAANVRAYGDRWYSEPKDVAQAQLSGRSHYADDSTLKYFAARINETRIDSDGLWFALRESVQPPQSGRVHRWAIFDVFGRCVKRTDDRSNGAGADRRFAGLVASTDWYEHTLTELKNVAERKEYEAGLIRSLLKEDGIK